MAANAQLLRRLKLQRAVPIKREICPGQDPRQTNEQTILALEFTAERAHPKSGSLCTDLNSVCYNLVTEHGQMLGVAIACGRFLAVFHTVHLLSIWYRKLVIFDGTD